MVNDVIAYDVSTLLGPKADHFAFEECLESVGLYGRAEHIVVSGMPLYIISFAHFFVLVGKIMVVEHLI